MKINCWKDVRGMSDDATDSEFDSCLNKRLKPSQSGIESAHLLQLRYSIPADAALVLLDDGRLAREDPASPT